MRGLLGQSSLPIGEGLLLKPAPSVHTAFMRFPIDVVFTDRDLHVLKLVEWMKPWHIASARRAYVALELSAGEIARREIGIGDFLEVDDKPAFESGTIGRPPWMHAATERNGISSESRGASPTRVLLITTDRRFRAVAGALLARRECKVSIAERMVDVAQLAKREAADIVILDVGPTLTAAARESAQIELIEPPVTVVLVGDEDAGGLDALPVLPKWDAFEAMYEAIENVSGRSWIES